MTVRDLIDQAHAITLAFLGLSEDKPVEEALLETVGRWDDDATDKMERLYHVLRRMDAEETLLAEEIGRLSDRKSRLGQAIARVKQMALELAQTNEDLTGRKKWQLPTVTATLVDSPPKVRLVDGAPIPEEFIRVKHETLYAQIRDALLAGRDVPGATLERGQHVRFK